ncbi:unnamed protein product [Camellia sinensis]
MGGFEVLVAVDGQNCVIPATIREASSSCREFSLDDKCK